ncbi:MAG: NADH-quinone oxidoreductase subunit J family protein [Thermoguttaceae bacterium]
MIDWHTLLFLLLAGLTCFFAVAVVVSANVVRMAVCLIASLSAVAGLYVLAGADFVGAMQLMIYVGGTLVLLVFGVMLTAQGPGVSLTITWANWLMAALAGGALLILLVWAAASVDAWSPQAVADAGREAEPAHTVAPLGMALLGMRVDRLDRRDATLERGMSGYLLPFEIVSVHLLVVLIGAAHLARGRRKRESTDP